MTDEEFRTDLLAAAAARAEAHETGLREAFTSEVLERLRDAGEVPDAESCAEVLTGHRSRKLEVDAFAFDDADESVHLFVTIRDGGVAMPGPINLTEAREQGFGRLIGVFEQSRDGGLAANTEESRPLWALARWIQTDGKPSALRLHVLTDRPMSERLREIKGDRTREDIPVAFQIWDVTRLKRIHEARSARDDLFVDQDNPPEPRKDEIGRAGQVPAVQPEPITERVRQPAHRDLRRGVRGANARHQRRASFRGDRVHAAERCGGPPPPRRRGGVLRPLAARSSRAAGSGWQPAMAANARPSYSP